MRYMMNYEMKYLNYGNMTFKKMRDMGKTKLLLEDTHHRTPDWILDAEYHEWAIYSQRPYVAPLSNENNKTDSP